MRFENAFEVDAPVETVWATMLDVERVAPCMPGAQVLETTGDDTFKVAIKVKVGPIAMTYRGDVEIAERDDANHRSTLHVKAKETRGQGSADARVEMSLDSDGGRTLARLDTEVQLTGKAASMGRGVIGDVAERLVQTFAGNLAGMLGEAGAAAAPPPAGPPPASAGPPPASAALPPASAAAAPPPPSAAAPRPSAPPPAEALQAGELAASVIAGRLATPRALVLAVAAVGGLGALIGYRLGRRG